MLAIEVEFLMGRALITGTDERNVAEWPPHPQRLFSALVASAADLDLGTGATAALDWLETLPPPEIRADEKPSLRQVRGHFVPVNDETVRSEKGRQDFRHVLERRSRQERFFPAVVPNDPVVVYQWPNAEGKDQHVGSLAVLVEGLTYLGHSASPVRACVRAVAVEPTFVPGDGDIAMRVPGPGRRIRLNAVHELRRRDESVQPPLGRVQTYSGSRRGPTSHFAPQALVLAFKSGPRLALDSALPLMQHLRNALLSKLGPAAPGVLTGHDGAGHSAAEPHLALVPLAFIGAPHADGSLKGAALVLPLEAGVSAARRIRNAAEQVSTLHLGPLGSLRLELVDQTQNQLKALVFSRYCGRSTWWGSATPVVLDRHPKRNRLTVETIVADACERIGLPRPEEVRLGSVSAFRGVPRAGDFHGQAKQTDARLTQHVLLKFPEEVSGPVLLGAGRFIGLGVCLPFKENRTE
jgi:CRISPR-associated protein Csb2